MSRAEVTCHVIFPQILLSQTSFFERLNTARDSPRRIQRLAPGIAITPIIVQVQGILIVVKILKPQNLISSHQGK